MKDLKWGAAYYIELEQGEQIDARPVQLSPEIMLNPGDKIKQLGTKMRASFTMKDGWSLVFMGWFGRDLLFDAKPDQPKIMQCAMFEENRRIYYAFCYVAPGVLFVPAGKLGGYDITI